MISLCQHSRILTAKPGGLTMQGITCTTRRILTRSNSFMREWDQGGEPLVIPLGASPLAFAFLLLRVLKLLHPYLPILSFRCCFQLIPNSILEHDPCENFFEFNLSDPVHTKTIVNANASKRKLFYASRPSVHTKTMITLTVNT